MSWACLCPANTRLFLPASWSLGEDRASKGGSAGPEFTPLLYTYPHRRKHMSRLSIPTVDQSVESSRPLLAAVNKQLGMAPNLMNWTTG